MARVQGLGVQGLGVQGFGFRISELNVGFRVSPCRATHPEGGPTCRSQLESRESVPHANPLEHQMTLISWSLIPLYYKSRYPSSINTINPDTLIL